MVNENKVILIVRNLSKKFSNESHSGKDEISAINNVNLILYQGETLGIIGDSGSGKSTLMRSILLSIKPESGEIFINPPEDISDEIQEIFRRMERLERSSSDDLEEEPEYQELIERYEEIKKEYSATMFRGKKLKEFRKNIQAVLQDSSSSFDPKRIIRDSLGEPLIYIDKVKKSQIIDREITLVSEVGLREDHLFRYPYEMSGGQLQRLAIAKALSVKPKLIVLDEPTSSLDVSIQGQILNLLKDMQSESGISYILVSHNLGVIRVMANRVAVMFLGEIIEMGETEIIFTEPLHPYTQALMSAIPIPEPKMIKEKIPLKNSLPDPSSPPKGCRFHTRCPVAMKTCGWSPNDMMEQMSHILNKHMHPEAEKIPEVVKMNVLEEDRSLELVFGKDTEINSDEITGALNEIINREKRGKMSVLYDAVEDVGVTEEKSVYIRMIEPEKLQMWEKSPGHSVACLLYKSEENN
ncbi:oligopeptide/dipeptide ABC transporter ATP-binding protein [Caldiplasma sukawensis]